MDQIKPLFHAPLQIESAKGDRVWVSTLTRAVARSHAAELVRIHSLIPLVNWSEEDLLSDRIGEREFYHKWDLSLIVMRNPADPVGFLVSYLRPADSNLGSISVYMHRMAIIAVLQRRGIGRRIISEYLRRVFESVPVDYVTLQTNDTPENIGLVEFYESLGFTKAKRVSYPEKVDWLMACPRTIAENGPDLPTDAAT